MTTSNNRPALTTSPSKVEASEPVETTAQKLARLNEENELLRAELVNIDLRNKVEAAKNPTTYGAKR